LNQKVKGLAKVSALSYKVKENNLLVVEDVKMEAPKTKEFVGILKSLNADGKKVLFLAGDENENLYLSFRNLPNVQGYQFNDMNTYDIVNADVVVMTEGTAKAIAEDVKEVSAN
jgi:large subunit ribosomal protein L4